MSKFNLLRNICRFGGIASCVLALISVLFDWTIGIIIGFVLIALDIVIIAIKTVVLFAINRSVLHQLKEKKFAHIVDVKSGSC